EVEIVVHAATAEGEGDVAVVVQDRLAGDGATLVAGVDDLALAAAAEPDAWAARGRVQAGDVLHPEGDFRRLVDLRGDAVERRAGRQVVTRVVGEQVGARLQLDRGIGLV